MANTDRHIAELIQIKVLDTSLEGFEFANHLLANT
jgi:hypothetical protein